MCVSVILKHLRDVEEFLRYTGGRIWDMTHKRREKRTKRDRANTSANTEVFNCQGV